MVRTTPPAKTEALGSEITFEYDGKTYAVPPASDWDLGALDAFENDKVATCVKLILGEAQWRVFRSKRRTVADLNGLFTALNAAVGTPN